MDARYLEAFHLLAQIYDRMGRPELAEQVRQKTSGAPPPAPEEQELTSGAKRVGKTSPLFHPRKSGTPRLLVGADKRIINALREDALQAFKLTDQQSH